MEKLLFLLVLLTGLSFLFMVYGYIEEYLQKQAKYNAEQILEEIAIKNLAEKNKVQGIKKITKKPKTTTDMIKVNGKTQVVKRDKKGHFVK